MATYDLALNQVMTQEREFHQPMVSIGSHPDNDLPLSGLGVLPFHITAVLDNGQIRLIPLEPNTSIQVDGAFVQDAALTVTSSQQVEIGGHVLLFRPNGSQSGIVVTSYLSVENGSQAQPLVVGDESTILLNVLSKEAEVDVEQSATFEFELINGGPIVASFFVSVRGVPDKWVEITPAMVNLNEGQRSLIRIRVTPPREATSAAGLHSLDAVVTSPNYAGHYNVANLSLTIKPFYEFAIGNLSPKDQRISWRKRTGMTYLPITNQGNGPADFSLMAVDDENGCIFDFWINEDLQLTRQATAKLQAGETAEIPIQITPLKRPMFAWRNKRYHFNTNIAIPQQTALPQTVSGSVTSVPLFGWWSIMLSIVTVLLAVFFLVQPNIHSFQTAAGKDVIELGDATNLVWNVSPFATRLSISNVSTPINRGQTSITVAPTQSTTYEMVAGNWLSGLVGLDQKRTVIVLVVPPTPKVNLFDIDKTTIAKGQSVHVRWSVADADQAYLTIDNVIYPLTSDKFNGEQDVTLEKSALITMEAKNGSGSELQSYYVNVVPPHIAVNSFTVWVKPDSSAYVPGLADASGSGASFSPSEAPDPNFPEKFVELISDPASDNGYRVEFNPNIRSQLQKGEEVIVEWDISGADSIQISPFTDALPDRGSQPFFPQESMNFVMTAQSGDLKDIFMLPVNVFNGQPPTAPTIGFFKASPASMTGAGDVEFSWSVTGQWTRINLSNASGIIADYLNPVGFKTLKISKSSTIILTAYNNNLSSAQPVEVTVNPALAKVGIYFKSVFPASGRFSINDSVQVTMDFYDPAKSDLTQSPPVYVAPSVEPTGQIYVTDGVSLCTISLPARTCTLKFTTPDDPKQITASYSGDKVYLPASTKAPYSGYIAVAASTVEMTPTYYLLDPNSSTPAPLGTPISVNTTPLKLDTGLYIPVTITPQGVSLSTSDPGKVTLNLCEQQTNPTSGQLEIKPGTCVPIASSSVTTDSSGVQGTAVLVLRSFPKTGTFALLFSFNATGFVPKDRPEFNVRVDPVAIYLSLASCTDPQAFTGCEVGTSNPAKTDVIFDIRKKDDGQKLSSQLTAPPSAAFQVYEDNSGVKTDWTCNVIPVSEGSASYYKLDCTVDFSTSGTSLRSPVYVNFTFDNANGGNYTMAGTPLASDFPLKIKVNTRVSLDSQKFTNVKVGQSVRLTSANTTDTSAPADNAVVILTDFAFQGVTTNGDIQVTADQTGVFNTTSSSTGCSVDSNGQVVTISSITTDCAIFFTKVGNFNISVSFQGDDNFYPSASFAPLAVTISQQDGITINWKQGSPLSAWGDLAAISPNSSLPIRLELGGPTGFSGKAFSGKSLNINLTITDNSNRGACKLSGNGSSPYSYPMYTATINPSSSPAYADFALVCDKEPMTITISVTMDDSTDFAFAAGQTTSRVLAIANRGNRFMTVSFIRSADSDPVITGNALKPLYMGEEYQVTISAYPLWADAYTGDAYPTRQAVINAYLAGNPYTSIALPAEMAALVDTSSLSHCSLVGNSIQVPLDSYSIYSYYGNTDLNSTGITDITLSSSNACRFKFMSGTELTQTYPVTFTFSINDPNGRYGTWTATNAYSGGTVTKQPVTITPSFTTYKAYVDDGPTTLLLNFLPTVSQTLLAPLDASFSSLLHLSNTCTGLITSSSVVSTKQASMTLSPSNVGGTCNTTLGVEYNGNSWFQDNNSVSIAISVIKHLAAVATIEYKQGTFRDLVPTYPTMKVGQSMDMRVRVSDGDGLGHTQIPQGVMWIWMENSSGKLDPNAASPIYGITLGSGITYDSTNKVYVVTLDNTGAALFTLNFKAAATGLSLHYQYRGSSLFSSAADLSANSLQFTP